MAENAEASKTQRISVLTAVFMVAVAIGLDAAQDLALFLNALPVIGTAMDIVVSWFIGALAAIVFGVWFALLRVSYFTGKKAATKMLIMFSSVVVELIPFVDALPAITFGVVALIIQTRIEDSGTTGLGIKQVLVGAGQVASAFGVEGAGLATKALAKESQRPSEVERRAQFLDLRAARSTPTPPGEGGDTPTQ
jgi:hypothetical protein